MPYAFDTLKLRSENIRRSTAMLPPHATVVLGREDLVDILDLVLAVSDQVRGRGAAA